MAAGKADLDAAQTATAVVLASLDALIQGPPAPPAPQETDLTQEVAAENALTDKARSILLKLQPQPPADQPPVA